MCGVWVFPGRGYKYLNVRGVSRRRGDKFALLFSQLFICLLVEGGPGNNRPAGYGQSMFPNVFVHTR